MDKSVIELRKRANALMNESKRRAKKTECIWCGKKITSFCNSHSIPQCIIRNIEVEGKVDYFNALAKNPILDYDKGVNEAGTFKLLCKNCDSKLFQDYENLDRLREKPDDRMLAEIVLKNLMVMLNKRYIEVELPKVMAESFNVPRYFNTKTQLQIKNLDIRDFGWEYLRTKKIIQNSDDVDVFRLLFWKKLDYVIPIAFQGQVVLYGDLEGNIVSDIYDNSTTNVVKNLHVCLFPLKKESVVFAFYHKDDHEYDAFANQFERLDDEAKLQLLSYILYERCEDMLFAKKFPHRTWMIDKITEVFVKTPCMHLVADVYEYESVKRKELCSLMNRDVSFPNILTPKFALERQ